MNKRFILLLLLVILLSSCSSYEEPMSYESIITDGKEVFHEVPDGKKVIYWFSDPKCPACLNLSTAVFDSLEHILKEKNAVLKIVLINALDGSQVEHSTKTSAFIYALRDNQSELVLPMLRKVMNIQFLSENQDKESTDYEYFREAYFSVGGQENLYQEIKQEATERIEMVSSNKSQFLESQYFAERSPANERVFVPFIYEEGKSKAMRATTMDSPEEYLDAFTEYLK